MKKGLKGKKARKFRSNWKLKNWEEKSQCREREQKLKRTKKKKRTKRGKNRIIPSVKLELRNGP